MLILTNLSIFVSTCYLFKYIKKKTYYLLNYQIQFYFLL